MKNKLQNESLHDEFFLQIFRQVNRKNIGMSEQSAKSIAHSLFILALLSQYAVPSSDMVEVYE